MIEIKRPDGLKVIIYNVDEREIRDLAYCAYLSRKNPIWHDGLIICACSDILDSRSIAREFIKNKTILIEQLCYSHMPEYKRTLKITESDVLVTTPIIKSYGFFKYIAEYLTKMLKDNERNKP